jgi:hypothetical protein
MTDRSAYKRRPIVRHEVSASMRAHYGTEARMAGFLAELEQGYGTLDAERRAGVSAGLSGYWRRRDPEFQAAVDAAKKRGAVLAEKRRREALADRLVAEAEALGVRDLLAERLTAEAA